MAEIIRFPVEQTRPPQQANIEDDPYYRFISNVLSTADHYGIKLPFTIESAARHVYEKTKETSQLAKLLRNRT